VSVDTLGKALRQRRGDLSQRAAARELGVAVQTYIWWERGATTPRLHQAEALAVWLGIPQDDVLKLLHDGEVQALRDREQDRPTVKLSGSSGAYRRCLFAVPNLTSVA
jgi:transcriptional regulator with XRE-family HTH domain